MPTITHGFDWPDRFVVGTVGMPGDRTFYLQARDRGVTVSVSLEKQQSAALAEGIEELLTTLRNEDGNPHNIPDVTPDLLVDNDPLDLPLDEEFQVGVLTLGWDPTTSQIVVEAAPPPELEPEELEELQDAIDSDSETFELEVEPDEVFVVRMPVGAARAFVDRTKAIVGAGRPTCPRCGRPIDPEDGPAGHVCEFPDEP
ncbi:MAG: DUF3090 family protein [Corynebacterium sp.]|uniref:DUF3090 family protein n=1 Tax=Corynebacterium sp. TaxID=1720 RepID=UPI003F998601